MPGRHQGYLTLRHTVRNAWLLVKWMEKLSDNAGCVL